MIKVIEMSNHFLVWRVLLQKVNSPMHSSSGLSDHCLFKDALPPGLLPLDTLDRQCAAISPLHGNDNLTEAAKRLHRTRNGPSEHTGSNRDTKQLCSENLEMKHVPRAS